MPSSRTRTAVEAETTEAEAEPEVTNGVVPDGVFYHAIRGKVYRIEELTAKEYEDCQRKSEVADKETEGATTTDMLMLEKLVTLKSVTIVEKVGDPPGEKLDADTWAKERYPVTSRVTLEVRRAHYMSLTDEEKASRTDPNA